MPLAKEIKDKGPTEKVKLAEGKVVLQHGKEVRGTIEVTAESRRHLERCGCLEGSKRTAPRGYSDLEIEEAIEAGSTGKKPYRPGKKRR